MIKAICPVCHQPIAVSLYQIKEGERFACPRCFSSLAVQCMDPLVLVPCPKGAREDLYMFAEEELERRRA